MIFGYARVSTQDQNLDLQIDDLKKSGCERIFRENMSSVKERPEFNKLLDTARAGDTIVVWKLDRLGRSLKDLIHRVNEFQKNKIGFRSLNDAIDTTTAHGRLIFNIFASLAEFERDLIRDRTKASRSAARARGRMGGKPKGLNKQAQSKAHAAKALYDKKDRSAGEIGKILGISRATVYRYIKEVEHELRTIHVN